MNTVSVAASRAQFCETYNVLKTGRPHHWEATGPDGGVIDVHNFPFTDVDGSPMILEMDLDITARRRSEAELEKHRHHLEELVQERTGQWEAANAQLQAEIAQRERAAKELSASNEELARFNRAMVDRELRMIELKKQVNELCVQHGQPPPYALDFDKGQP